MFTPEKKSVSPPLEVIDSAPKPKLHDQLQIESLPAGVYFAAVKDHTNTKLYYIRTILGQLKFQTSFAIVVASIICFQYHRISCQCFLKHFLSVSIFLNFTLD